MVLHWHSKHDAARQAAAVAGKDELIAVQEYLDHLMAKRDVHFGGF
jgi:hypothetical protein